MTDDTSRRFYVLALILLIAGVNFGVLAAHSYTSPGLWKESLGFIKLRPMHVTSVLFWILLGATGAIYGGLSALGLRQYNKSLVQLQLLLWLIAIGGIFFSYFNNNFGGREYWEFPQQWSVFILAAWLILVVNYFYSIRKIKNPPVYIWMWGTGVVFFLFIFIENYLWIFPYFRENFIRDTTIQWKVNGSLVGCWNQIIYGSSIFLMERISGDKKAAHSRLAFSMYFLGLFNLMFNWSHHIYTLPTAPYIRYIGYAVSMTEWIILLRIIYNFKRSLSDAKKHIHQYSYRFLIAADAWVFINLFMALLMSVPAINIYTHGTHVTVAHAMGTTIGINTMILLALLFEEADFEISDGNKLKWWNIVFYSIQCSLFILWVSLIVAGVKKSIWYMNNSGISYTELMQQTQVWFRVFSYSGSILMLALCIIAIQLIVKLSGGTKPVLSR